MKARSKISKNRAQAAFEAWLLKLKPHSTNDSYGYPFYIDTHYGKLYISFSLAEARTLKHVGGPAYDWIMMRFEQPERSKGLQDTNQFSGKWNFHLGLDSTADELHGILNRMIVGGVLSLGEV